MFCTKCGAKMYDDNAEFCSVCGAALKQQNNSTSYESETEKINRLVDEIKQEQKEEKSVNDLFNDFLKELENKSQEYKSDFTQKDIQPNPVESKPVIEPQVIKSKTTLVEPKPIQLKTANTKQTEEEWLDPEAIQEIWSVPQNNIKPQNQTLPPVEQTDWIDDINEDEYENKFHLMEHPLIFTSIVAFFMAMISILSIVVIWNV